MIGELSILVAGGTDNKLVVFIVESTENGINLKLNSGSIVKESNHRAL